MHKATRTRNSHRAGDLLRDYRHIKSILSDTTHDLKESGSDLFTHSLANVKDKSTDVKDGLQSYIVKKPFQSVGIALLSGLLVGYFIHKK